MIDVQCVRCFPPRVLAREAFFGHRAGRAWLLRRGSVSAGTKRIPWPQVRAARLHANVWQAPFEQLRMPMIGNLRTDPFERAHKEGIGYGQWQFEHMFALAPAGAYVGQWLESFKQFPPRQKPGSFNLNNVMEALMKGAADK